MTPELIAAPLPPIVNERLRTPYEDLGNPGSTWNPPTSTLPRRPSPPWAMVEIKYINKLECVQQPVEARILENAPRGAREHAFLSGVPPSGSKFKARLWTPLSVHLANLPRPPWRQQQEAPHGECSVGTSRTNVTDLDPFFPALLQRGTAAWL